MENKEFESYLAKYGLINANPLSDEYFTGVMQIAIDEYKMPIPDIAREFGVSIVTVERWQKGKGAPHPVLRPSVLEWLIENI
ncbi:MAG: helix-turn-helix domain-containing protein [Nanoarchaeota archaeon]